MSRVFFPRDEHFMRLALREAERALEHDDVPIGCVIVHDGSVRNCRVLKGLPLMNTLVIDALERRRYRPATAQGKPVDVYYTFNVRLSLPQ